MYTEVTYPKVWDLWSGLGGGGSSGHRFVKLSTSVGRFGKACGFI